MNEIAPVDEARIIDAMRAVLAKRFGIERSSLDLDQPIESLGLDSMAFVEYVFDLETELNIIFPDVPTHLVTLRDFVQFVCDEVTIQRQRAEPMLPGSDQARTTGMLRVGVASLANVAAPIPS